MRVKLRCRSTKLFRGSTRPCFHAAPRRRLKCRTASSGRSACRRQTPVPPRLKLRSRPCRCPRRPNLCPLQQHQSPPRRRRQLSRKSQRPRPKPAPVAPTPAAPAAVVPRPPIPFSPAPAARPDDLQLPFSSVITVLPMDLCEKLIQTPPSNAVVSIPMEKALSQLAHGSVKISFGELRARLPGLFDNSSENDERQIALPLNEIISRVKPVLLTRHAAKKVEVADNIPAPFSTGKPGVGSTPAQAPVKPAPAPPSKAPAPAIRTPVTPSPTVAPKTMAAAPKPAPVAPTPAAPAAAIPRAPDKPVFSAPPVRATPTPPSSAPAAGDFKAAPKIPFPAAHVPADNFILAPLSALAENWPDAIKKELLQTDMTARRPPCPPR